jgi:PEGA domain
VTKRCGASWLVVVAVLAAAATSARADEPAPLDDARRHFQQGVALYNDGDFNAALAEFEAAWRLHPSSGVLYNIGLTQKSLFRYTDAIATLERYLTEETRLAPERRAEVTQVIVEMKALLAPLEIDVTPPGAALALDGRPLGSAPLACAVPAGSHALDATLDGYQPARKQLMVTAGVPLRVALTLDPLPRTGRVRIAVTPPIARIRIDGRVVGGPPATLELLAGGHQLEITAPAFETSRTELVIAAGQARMVEIALARPPRAARFYEKWYFWAPLAVVVAAVAVGVSVALTPQPSPIKGTLDPGVTVIN